MSGIRLNLLEGKTKLCVYFPMRALTPLPRLEQTELVNL